VAWRKGRIDDLDAGSVDRDSASFAYASSPGFIALVGITIRSWLIEAPVMWSFAQRITTPSLRRSTTRV